MKCKVRAMYHIILRAKRFDLLKRQWFSINVQDVQNISQRMVGKCNLILKNIEWLSVWLKGVFMTHGTFFKYMCVGFILMYFMPVHLHATCYFYCVALPTFHSFSTHSRYMTTK